MDTHPKGIISKESRYSVKESMDRLQHLLESKGVKIFSRIDQQAEAQKVGLTLTPIELLIFGNPLAGTPIMSAVPLAALDLPLKALSWQDGEGKVWISFNEPAWLQQRYSLSDDLAKKIDFGPLVQAAIS